MVDNNPWNFHFQPLNGILIKSWYDDPEDCVLTDLSVILMKLIEDDPDDVREYLKEIKIK